MALESLPFDVATFESIAIGNALHVALDPLWFEGRPDFYVVGKDGRVEDDAVKMVKMSDAGFPVNEPVTIESPWRDVQTKPAGQDAFILLDGDSRYMVNVGPDGNPISYIPRKQP